MREAASAAMTEGTVLADHYAEDGLLALFMRGACLVMAFTSRSNTII